ncbi:MAG: hypothetical protein GW839_14300 [Flavobacteriales bacterium]|nr:hypothetical protein [Flavobacteriales bacterium]
MTEVKSDHFDNAVNKYLNHIESLWTSMPIVLKTIERTKNSAIAEHSEFLNNNCNFIESENHFLIPIEHIRKNSQLRKSVDNSTTAIKIIKRNFLVSIVSQFDTYVSDLIKAIFEVRPEIIQNSEKQLTFSELSKFATIQEAQDYIIEKEIETVLRESYTEQFKWFENKLKIQLRKDLPIWQTFIEITQRRNLFVHNDGKISTQYLNVCKEHNVQIDDKLKVGDELDVGLKYFDKSFKCLFEIGVKLNQVLRRNLMPDELEKADNSFLNISFELIQNSQLDLAKTLYDFSDKYIKKYSNDDLKLRILLNRAQTYKWLDKEKECAEIINSIDWTATGDLFKLASKVLIDDFKSACEIMKNIGDNEKVLNKTFYKDWPIFKKFRGTDEFKQTYLEIFKIEFEITEEKNNSTQQHLPKSGGSVV